MSHRIDRNSDPCANVIASPLAPALVDPPTGKKAVKSASQSVGVAQAIRALIDRANQPLLLDEFQRLQIDSQLIADLSAQLQSILYSRACPAPDERLYEAAHDAEMPNPPALKITLIPAESESVFKPKQKLVLVAEDNPVNQKVALWQLRELGFAVDIAANGNDVVRAALSNSYALIFMDCDMPIQNGFDATRAIRKKEQETQRRTPIIAMTAQVTPADKRRCFSAGMDGYLTKPVRQEDLKRVVEMFIRDPEETKEQPLAFDMLEQNLGAQTSLEVLDVYARSTADLVVELQQGLKQQNQQVVANALQELSSSCTVVGAIAVVQQCERLQDCLDNSQWNQMDGAMAELLQETRTVRQYVAQLLSKSDGSHI